MRDVSHKTDTLRTACARAVVRTTPEAVLAARGGTLPKGDPIPVARVAGIQAAKATATLIPFCHPVPVDFVALDFEFSEREITVTARVKAVYKTGVEMEALTAAAVAALNLYDMIKPIESDIEVTSVLLLEKTGGKSDLPQSRHSVGVVTVSDRASRGEYEDLTGPAVVRLLMEHGQEVVEKKIVPDEVDEIRAAVMACIAGGARIVLTLGGTGVGPRDVTPEAVSPLIEKPLPGVAEAVYAFGRGRTPFAALGRVTCGTCGGGVILTLPGSPRGATEGTMAALPALLHAAEVLDGADHERTEAR